MMQKWVVLCGLMLVAWAGQAQASETVYLAVVLQSEHKQDMAIPIDAEDTASLFKSVSSAKSDVVAYVMVPHVSGKKSFMLSADLLDKQKGELSDNGIDCSFFISVEGKLVSIGGLCELNINVGGNQKGLTSTFPPSELASDDHWLLLSYDENSGIGVYAMIVDE